MSFRYDNMHVEEPDVYHRHVFDPETGDQTSFQTMTRSAIPRYEAGELRMTKEMLKWLLACRTLELLLGHPPTYGLPEQNRNIHYSSRIYKVWPH